MTDDFIDALAAWRMVDTPLRAGIVFLLLLAVEIATDRSQAPRTRGDDPVSA